MTALWRIQLFGELRALQGEREVIRFRTHKTAVLLATLACQPARMFLREHLLAQLWPDADPGDARNNLSVALSSLRNQFEPPGETAGSVIRADRQYVGLNPAGVSTDVSDFERTLDGVDRLPTDAERIVSLESALSHYSGSLLPGFYEDWLADERRRLAERHHSALRALVRLLVQSQELVRALEWARRAVAADPLREEAQRDLMRLLVATGQPTAALQQFRDLEARLRQELDAQPASATRRMVAEIQAKLQASDTPSAPPSVPIQSTVRTPTPPSEAPADAGGLGRQQADPDLRQAPESRAPEGTVTFVLTQLAEGPDSETEGDEALKERLRAQQDLLGPVWNRYRGYVCERTRDAWEVAFSNARDALLAAVAGQRALATHADAGFRTAASVRMALHSGAVMPQEGRYYSRALQWAARLLHAGHAGQILCSEVTAALLRSDLDSDASLVDLGVYRLIGLTTPERVYQVSYPDQPVISFGALRAEFATASHLPLPISRFFGRENDLARLVDLLPLPQTRLVTLTGPGGTGKTRLALEVARRMVELYAGAVWFVPLGDVASEGLLTSAVADALGVARTTGQDPMTQIVTALAAQPCLLVLDNLEHLLAPASEWLRDVLGRVSTVTCLATSRERLNLDGEYEQPVGTLPVPPRIKDEGGRMKDEANASDASSPTYPSSLFSFPSVALFVDRCQAVQPDFHLTPDNAAAVSTLCGGLEGLPLAIELAAARAQVATPAQMVVMLGRRFDLLVSRRRDLAARHRTMRATIEWSYNLLSPELQRFFRLLSVFRGGWNLEAAEAVCDEPLALDYLAQLREGSLIVTDERAGEMRYGMLETLREYAREQLGHGDERAWVCHGHLRWFLALAEEAAPDLLGPRQRHWLERLEAESDNLRAAFAWCLETPDGVESALRLVGYLWLFWYIRGHVVEGCGLCTAALAQAGEDAFPKARADALNGAGNLAYAAGDHAQARVLHKQSLGLRRMLGDLRGEAGSLNNLGNVAVHLHDHAAARAYFDQALGINRTIGNRSWEASNLHNLGEIAKEEGRYDEARANFNAALIINQETGNEAWKATNLKCLGDIAQTRGDLATARGHFEEALQISESLGDRPLQAHTLDLLGSVAEQQGDLPAAQTYHERAIGIKREIGNATSEQINVPALARIAARQPVPSESTTT